MSYTENPISVLHMFCVPICKMFSMRRFSLHPIALYYFSGITSFVEFSISEIQTDIDRYFDHIQNIEHEAEPECPFMS